MGVRNLDHIFKPRRIALVGAGEASGQLGRAVIGNLLDGGFDGVVYPVDARHEGIGGIPTFAGLDQLPAVPDLALICSPAARVPELLEQCGRIGVRGAVILSGGFRESGLDGRMLEARLSAILAGYPQMRVIGPNSLGVIAPESGLNASHAMTRPKAGHLAFVSESRALCNAVLDWATDQGIGFSHFVSIGNMLDVGFGDLIDYFNQDSRTRAIILYLQSIRHARSFMSAARAFARVKPIVACKAGRFDESARAAASHTGAMVAEDAVYDAAFERAGVVRVAELDDVFDVAELLAAGTLPRGSRLAIVGNAGGPAIIAADALLTRGGRLARFEADTLAELDRLLPPVGSHANPVDLLDSAPPSRFAEAIAVIGADPGVDGILVVFAAQTGSDALATAEVVASASRQQSKPVLAAWMGGERVRPGVQHLNAAGLATHATPEQAVRAFMHLFNYSRNLETLYETPRDLSVRFNVNRKRLRGKLMPKLARRRQALTEQQARDFLRAYDIPVVGGAVAASAGEAVAAAERIGFPVVLKVMTPLVVHRTDVGGVALDLRNAADVERAYRRILDSVGALHPGAPIQGVTVQQMRRARGGHELILGSKKDSTFGAVLMVGAGGVTTDVLRDRALGLPPLNERLARRMLESLRIWPLLQGYRNRPAVNLDRLIEVMLRFSCLIADYPEIGEFDINPLLVTADEVVALDALAVPDPDDPGGADPFRHLAIRPYPDEYIRRTRLADGTPVTLRSVRPEDEPLWRALIESASAESIRSRFRAFFRRPTHRMAVDYCVIDYEREIAIVAEIGRGPERRLVGLAHLLADANRASAEFAVLVPDPWQGKGLGGLLLDHCLELAGRWGIERVVAETSPRNRAMLATFRRRGFAEQVSWEDATVYLEWRVGRSALASA